MPKLFRPREVPKQSRPLSARTWAILQEIDTLLLDREKRAQQSYAEIRRVLNRVPRAERGIDWTERVVALYCVKGMKTQRSAALKINIRAMRLEKEQNAELDEFLERLRKITAPYILTNHGLQLPFAHRDQDEVADDLIALFDLLKSLGYDAFINSGTLLGAVREGQFLGHDDDADLAVHLEGDTDADMINALDQLCGALNASGKLRRPAWYQKNGPILKVLVGSGVEVDLFPLWFRDGRAYIWPHTFGELTRDDIFPLGTQMLCGKPMPAPKDAEKMLALNYGEGWRHPDPDYFFPWDAAKQRFAAVLAAYVRHRNPHAVGAWIKRLMKGKSA